MTPVIVQVMRGEKIYSFYESRVNYVTMRFSKKYPDGIAVLNLGY